ncbi:hypothetical protein N9L68_01285 [bacterium]|nr:hypothetical protein [bacterium]
MAQEDMDRARVGNLATEHRSSSTSSWVSSTCPWMKEPRFVPLPPHHCERSPTATDGSAHPIGTEGRLLILSELNGVLIWRDYSGGSGLARGETVEMPSGRMITMFIRPAAEALVASLLWEPRCDFAIVSGMEEKYCLPIAERLLQRAASEGEWALERQGGAPCWALMGPPHTRVYVIGQAVDKQGGERVVKDLDRVWAALRECGCG